MKLLAFRVREFRSVDDTGWIDTEQVTALIGTNEAGKTNVLTPLWKLKPAKDGAIDAVADYPRKRYNSIRAMARKPIFIDARFELSEPVARVVAKRLRVSVDVLKEATVSRDFDGRYYVRFHTLGGNPIVGRDFVARELGYALEDLVAAMFREEDDDLKQTLKGVVQRAMTMVENNPSPEIEGQDLLDLEALLGSVDLSQVDVTSSLTARYTQIMKIVTDLPRDVSASERQAARDYVVEHVPQFVYYSHFGNLDAEIYLPHVIENMTRTDLGAKEAAKARTLKMLFDFVKLSPAEILALGKESPHYTGELTPAQEAEIASAAAQKKEREILLLAAGTDLTRQFGRWWKQGSYVFRFQADGSHFRIWVSDGKRPEPIELEGRSTGLQWFLSFYLVFLVESVGTHQGAVLLLDEPGLSLHPLAQRDLSGFFDGLAETNQLIYSTHSPFMVDTDHLDRARSVYSDDNGVTQVSPDLRVASEKSDQAKSGYVAYAAVGIATADAVLPGARSVIVEARSDQHYLTAIKNYLVAKGHLRPTRDILFIPGGNVRGTRALSGLLMGKDDDLPFVILDRDAAGRTFEHGLKTGLYSGNETRVLSVGDFRDIVDAEVEDLFPGRLMARVLDRYLRKPGGVDEDLVDVVKDGTAFVPQAEAYALKHHIALDEGWKVDLSKRVKTAILKAGDDPLRNDPSYLQMWRNLFALIHPDA